MGWIEFSLPAKGRVGKRRRAAAVKAIQRRDRDKLASFGDRPAPHPLEIQGAEVGRISDPPPVRINVVGAFFDNPDGTSRQEEAAKLKAGDPVELRREPDNKFDPAAVAVFSERGVQIGYLGEQRAGWLGSKLDRGMIRGASVSKIIGRRGRPLKPVIAIDLNPGASR